MASLGRRLVALVRTALDSRTRVGRGRPPQATTAVHGPDEVDVEYRPRDDDRPDPGEVVWAWVPYDEGDGRGKDRPVLVIGRRGGSLLGLMLTSKDHDRDAADEARHGRVWMDVGTGAWDSRRRPSEVRLDRLVVLEPTAVRREGAAMGRALFDEVVAAARRTQGW
ncbi:type II toxin-antitoxin system PemK/MazF family toxin [Blastococcus sp. TF02A-26]|uniref:type II toxin-antitoxin system PemK/MazF family toxin n=1 Tax=Blastococcus sp. TF02A-26 TaxID=2250577 RepID=UPI000DEBA495|nr:type II toxin-antitoxin system PemK/MazF family toxin [Blastococcus sp. TF02A-26]RBY84263.1 type II toxin-antitoxin system PemK/MazF family toxin [Blastococcus sp. TF02A-26]